MYGIGTASLGNLGDIVALDGFFTADDKRQHVIAATGDGQVHELYFRTPDAVSDAPLGRYPDIRDVAGFYTPDDKNRHVIVATGDGTVVEIFYGTTGQGQTTLGQFTDIRAIAGFYTPDDKNRHVIVATGDGSITEEFYGGRHPHGQALLGTFTDVVDVTGFYVPGEPASSGLDVVWEFFRGSYQVATDPLRIIGVATADGTITHLSQNRAKPEPATPDEPHAPGSVNREAAGGARRLRRSQAEQHKCSAK